MRLIYSFLNGSGLLIIKKAQEPKFHLRQQVLIKEDVTSLLYLKSVYWRYADFQGAIERTPAAGWSEKSVMDEVTKSQSPSFFITQTIKQRVLSPKHTGNCQSQINSIGLKDPATFAWFILFPINRSKSNELYKITRPTYAQKYL